MTQRVGARVHDDNDRGAVLPIVALSLTVLMVMTAFSVDIGRQLMRRREAQGAADVISLDMVRMVDGRTKYDIERDSAWQQTLNDSAIRNGFPPSGVTPTLGHWDLTTRMFTPSAAPADIPDAVMVTTRDVVDYFFARVIGLSQGGVTRSAVAIQTALARGLLGSVGAGFRYYNEPGVSAQYNVAAELRAQVLDSTLYTAFGMSGSAGTSAPPVGLNLDALAYKGIASSFITFGDLASELGFGSVDEMVAGTVSARDLLDAEVSLLRASGDPSDIAVGNRIASFASSASSTLTAELGDFLKFTQGQGGAVADMHINALDLMTASADIINGKNFFSTTVNTSIPGVPTVPIRVSVIEPPAVVIGPQGSGPCPPPDYTGPGCGPHTAQVRVATSIPVTLDLTPYGVPLVQTTTIPVVFEAAEASSMFPAIHCAQPGSNDTTDFRVLTNGVAMQIGSVTDAALQSSNTLSVQAAALLRGSVNLGLVSVNLDTATQVSESKTFKNGAVYNGDVTSNMGILGGDETHRFTGNSPYNVTPPSWRYDGGVGNTSISTTMFNNLGITNPVLNTAVSSALKSSLNNLDSLLMDPLLSAFGVTIAGADGSITDVSCGLRVVK